jgi:hypothetical protein
MQLARLGALSPGGPPLLRTIWDTIIAIASLGERYLLVDSLFIIQDDDQDRAEQKQHLPLRHNEISRNRSKQPVAHTAAAALWA